MIVWVLVLIISFASFTVGYVRGWRQARKEFLEEVSRG